MSVPAVRRITQEDLTAPGEFEYYTAYGKGDAIAGMIFVCPCGCGSQGSLDFRPGQKPRWNWNGDKNKPTLTPSVLKTSGCKWHGYLTEGKWRSV